MIYLILKLVVFLILAALLGFLLGRWWVRRQYRDVTEEYHRLARLPEELSQRFDALEALAKEPRLGSVTSQLEGLETAIAELPGPVDFQPVNSRLLALEAALGSIQIPDATDLEPVTTKLAAVEERLAAIPGPVDLEPVTTQLRAVEERIAAIPGPVDLSPFSGRFRAIEERVDAIAIPEAPDLQPVIQRFDLLEDRVSSATPEPCRLNELREDLDRLEKRIASLATDGQVESMLETLNARVEDIASRPEAAPVLYEKPVRGEPDDLKRISGVGRVLESMLHNIGVYYFDQVASWDEDQVDYVNSKLTAFKGRIRRDNWVAQAKLLAAEVPSEA